MDIKSLFAGYKPIAHSEVSIKIAPLERAYNSIVKAGYDKDYEEFVSNLPPEIVSHYFGTPALDAYMTENLAILHQIDPITDVFFAALLNELVMILTFQGRSLRRKIPPECALFIGESQKQLYHHMINGNVVYGLGINQEVNDYSLKETYIANFENNDNLIKNALCILPNAVCDFVNSQAFNIGLIALVDNNSINELNNIIDKCKEKIYEGTYFVLRGEPDQVFYLNDQLNKNFPNVVTNVRLYSYMTATGPKSQACLLLRGNSENIKFELVDRTPVPVNFINVQHMVNIGDPRFSIDTYGEKFIADGIAELVEVKAPIILKSSAPLPSYTRDILETAHPVAHVVARIQGGGVYYSRDHRHSTNIIVTRNNEVIEDFQESGSFEASPVYENSVLDGHIRTGNLEPRAKSFHAGTFIPLCFAPTVHHFHSHFLLQCFPRILIAREKCPDAKFFVPWDLRKYQKEMLNRVGVTDDKMVLMYPNTTYFADELIVPRLWPAIFTKYGEQIYSELVKSVGEEIPRPKRRILISREARTSWRNMVNYNVVKDILVNEFNFEVVAPEKLSLTDEILLFKDAQIIAGAEGAGLYNCCFASPNSAVLSIADQDYAMYIVGSMAAIRGFEVAYVFGESFLADADIPLRGAGHSDFIVAPEALRRAVRQLIQIMDAK